jgi:hypothetical protein
MRTFLAREIEMQNDNDWPMPDFGVEIWRASRNGETGEYHYKLADGRIVDQSGRSILREEEPGVWATLEPNVEVYVEGTRPSVDAALAKLRRGEKLNRDDLLN